MLLYAPNYLFLIPGILIFLLGIISMTTLYFVADGYRQVYTNSAGTSENLLNNGNNDGSIDSSDLTRMSILLIVAPGSFFLAVLVAWIFAALDETIGELEGNNGTGITIMIQKSNIVDFLKHRGNRTRKNFPI